eukprot:8271522-Pyramimonas_sp.AAC.1
MVRGVRVAPLSTAALNAHIMSAALRAQLPFHPLFSVAFLRASECFFASLQRVASDTASWRSSSPMIPWRALHFHSGQSWSSMPAPPIFVNTPSSAVMKPQPLMSKASTWTQHPPV